MKWHREPRRTPPRHVPKQGMMRNYRLDIERVVTVTNIKRISTMALASLMIGGAALTSCNEKSDSEQYLDTYSVAVTNFAITSDLGEQELDTIFFSIDLNRGVIFNADSLRKGTDVSKLVASISFRNEVSEAVIVMTGGTTRTGEIDYQKNPTDSIDFTGKVELRVKADDNSIGATYRIKVNVHQIDSDSLYWSESAVRPLPSRMASPRKQKTVKQLDRIVTMLQESDGTYTMATTTEPSAGKWSSSQVSPTFTPVIESLAATDESLWILDTQGNLYSSDDNGAAWTRCESGWTSLIGSYGNSVVGIMQSGSDKIFAQYPLNNLKPAVIPADFPVEGGSNFVTLTNKWTLSPVAFFVGGKSADGKLSDSTWAFDGTNWIKLSSGGVPKISQASLIPYYNFRPSAQSNAMIRYSVWMLLGGTMQDGKFNRTVYISYDNGVNWTEGSASLQLPESIPSMTGCDNVVFDSEMQANLSDAWKKATRNTRADYELDGDVIIWGCPYIYLFGGYAPDGSLYNTIWRGVLSRLTFTPIF